ncbi:MAG TPA: glycosyltransferase [Leptolyngbyaceae cyanobacterium]
MNAKNPINLSYIISTRNRLPFLKIGLTYLLENLQEDEEIVVVDGNSNDGTKEFLTKLYQTGKIHKYISEPDKNQAHGWNKAILLAEGKIIKKIIDDDLFCFPAIQVCKEYMLKNESVDLCISNCLNASLNNYKSIGYHSRIKQYLKWKDGHAKSFTFGDVSLLLRKSSTAYIGLYDTSFTMLDYEFSLRASYLQANIAYYNGCNAMSIFNPVSVSGQVSKATLQLDGKRANFMYEYAGDSAEINIWSKIKIFFGKNRIIFFNNSQLQEQNDSSTTTESLPIIYNLYYQFLQKYHQSYQSNFL